LENKYTEAYSKLFEAECDYLRANGWIKVAKDAWKPPEDSYWKYAHERKHGHAVNSQKFWDQVRSNYIL
jgi:hypothetical protein